MTANDCQELLSVQMEIRHTILNNAVNIMIFFFMFRIAELFQVVSQETVLIPCLIWFSYQLEKKGPHK